MRCDEQQALTFTNIDGEEIRMSWYYCLSHQQVEPEAGCPNAERMGPYATEEAAAAALERAHERNEEFDKGDD